MSQLSEKVDSSYLLVNAVAHRAREIAAEAEAQGESMEQKPVSAAIEEIAAGKYSAHLKSRF